MWVARTRYDALVAERDALVKSEAILRQHRDWLADSVNRLEAERGVLLQRLLGVNVPVAHVQPTMPARPTVGVAGRPLTDDAHEPVAGIDIGALMLGAAAFEDMGDDEAERQGIGPAETVVALTSR